MQLLSSIWSTHADYIVSAALIIGGLLTMVFGIYGLCRMTDPKGSFDHDMED